MDQNSPAKEDASLSLVESLLRRRVIQSIVLYVGVAWGSIEILLTFQDELGWPAWTSKAALAAFIAGFPLVVAVSWYRDLESRWAKAVITGGALTIAGIAAFLVLQSAPGTSRNSGPLPDSQAVLAILPFDIRTEVEAEAYLSRGFTGELIARLAKDPRLVVIQEASVTAPMLAALSPRLVAERLSADYYVEGGVRREGEFIEVQVWLRDRDGQILWSDTLRETYSASSVTAMQRRISTEVGSILGVPIDASAYCGDTADLTAMELYYQGRYEVMARTGERIQAGIELLKQAVERDPYYGRAWSALGEAYRVLPNWLRKENGDARSVRVTAMPMSNRALQKALDVCPTMGFAYKMLVPDYDVENDWIRHEQEFRDAVAMDPNDPSLLGAYSQFMVATGRMGENVRLAKRAYDGDPLGGYIVHGYANALYFLGRCNEAVPLAQQELDIRAHRKSTMVLENCAEMDEARTAGASQDPPQSFIDEQLAEVKALWELPAKDRGRGTINRIIWVAIMSGDLDLAFEVLNEQASYGHWSDAMVGGYKNIWYPLPPFDTFRRDPRFNELMRKVGLDEYWALYGYPEYCEETSSGFECGALREST